MTAEATVRIKPIPGFEGLYSVTDDGRVFAHERVIVELRRVRRKKAHWLKLIAHPDGYVEARLTREGVCRRWLVHRLVNEVFNGPAPAPGLLTRHLDGKKRNNVPSNLAWGTYLDNAADSKRLGEHPRREKKPRQRSLNCAAMLTEEKVLAIFHDKRDRETVAKAYGITVVHVSRIRVGRSWGNLTGTLPPRKKWERGIQSTGEQQ
jgi:hypothetical protein